ncbi:MAG: hypothetical protein HQL31_10595, partial [Planctomycetes bacterium]|nr:hypothetical protein [Planctomycetota bacterium]
MTKIYECECTVEFEDVDSYGIAHHSRLICMLSPALLNRPGVVGEAFDL